MPITPITAQALVQPAQIKTLEPTGQGFQNVLANAINHVESSTRAADDAAKNFLSGGNGELHSTILAAQSAGLDFEMFMQVRNKVVSAYEEIMRMQV